MSSVRPRLRVLQVTHASGISAIRTAAGGRRLLESGLADRLGAAGFGVEVREVRPAATGSPSDVAEAFALASTVAEQVRRALAEVEAAVMLSATCHMAVGAVAGLPAGPRGVIWLDAHGDFNTPETSTSGLLDGMTVATITGHCWKALAATVDGFVPVLEDAVLMIGVRDLDPAEEDLLEGSAVVRLSGERARTGERAVLSGLGERVDSVYLHVDLDVLDPSVGRANAYAVAGGFSADDLRAFLQEAGRSCPARVLGLASYDPSFDGEGAIAGAAIEAAGAWAAAVAGRVA